MSQGKAKVEYPAVTSGGNCLALTYGSGGSYSGFDRFGRGQEPFLR